MWLSLLRLPKMYLSTTYIRLPHEMGLERRVTLLLPPLGVVTSTQTRTLCAQKMSWKQLRIQSYSLKDLGSRNGQPQGGGKESADPRKWTWEACDIVTPSFGSLIPPLWTSFWVVPLRLKLGHCVHKKLIEKNIVASLTFLLNLDPKMNMGRCS